MSDLTLSIDPGLRHVAVALWDDGVLIAAALAETTGKARGPEQWAAVAALAVRGVGAMMPEDATRLASVVTEYPEHYHTHHQRVDDLMELAGAAGATVCGIVAQFGGVVHGLLPKEWKGSEAKSKTAARLRKELTEGELAVLVQSLQATPAGRHHDVIDAVGIGLAHLRREGVRS